MRDWIDMARDLTRLVRKSTRVRSDVRLRNMLEDALNKDRFEKVLMGDPGYRHLPKWTSASGNSDIAAVMDYLYDWILSDENRELVRERVSEGILRTCGKFEGLVPAFSMILIEHSRRARGTVCLDLGFEPSIAALRNTIAENQKRLDDPSECGYTTVRAELQRLAANIAGVGGPDLSLMLK